MASEFDFVIVGGGTAGLVLAARLTEDPNVQVVVVEAGEDLTTDPRINAPAMWTQLQGSDADWQLKTVPQVCLPIHRFSSA
jgi:choline dehydrogenase-like flavoprotein